MTFYPVNLVGGVFAAPATIAQGGTGQTTASGALGALGLTSWIPGDNGLLAATSDPALWSTSGSAISAGVQNLRLLQIRNAITLSTIWFAVQAAGSGTSTGCFAGLFSSAGTLLSGTSDILALFNGTGVKSVNLTTPQAIAAGSAVYVCLLSNESITQPTFFREDGSSLLPNTNLTGAAQRSATTGAGLTALTAFTPSGIAAAATFACGVS